MFIRRKSSHGWIEAERVSLPEVWREKGGSWGPGSSEGLLGVFQTHQFSKTPVKGSSHPVFEALKDGFSSTMCALDPASWRLQEDSRSWLFVVTEENAPNSNERCSGRWWVQLQWVYRSHRPCFQKTGSKWQHCVIPSVCVSLQRRTSVNPAFPLFFQQVRSCGGIPKYVLMMSGINIFKLANYYL